MRATLVTIIFIFSTLFASANAKPLPLEHFAKLPAYDSVKLSPDGKHLAVTVPQEDKTILAVINRAENKFIHTFYFSKHQHVASYYWVSNERLIFTRYEEKPWDKRRFSDGQIYAGNIDGTQAKIIFGYSASRNKTVAGRKSKGATFGAGRIANLLPNEEDFIVVESRTFGKKMDDGFSIYKVNVLNGRKNHIVTTPFGNMNVVYDPNGLPAFALGTNEEGQEVLLEFQDNEWLQLNEEHPLIGFSPRYMTADGKFLYVSDFPDGKTEAIYKYTIENQKIEKVFQDETSDIFDWIVDPNTRAVVGFKTEPGILETHYLETGSEFEATHKKLNRSLKDYDISVTSQTKDGNQLIVEVVNDKISGDFYLFDKTTNQFVHVVSKQDWLDPASLSARQPIRIQTRDDFTIHGYLTLPKGENKETPLVVYVHGGPYGVKDNWQLGFSNIAAQMLANNGYAVLQVNYRGSGGYGENYEEVAYQKRSTLIQHDIIDATKYTMSLPEVSDTNVCIMGWSFGGYSALMSPLIEPDLYKCAIPAAGVYNALTQEEDADYSKVKSVAAGAAKVYGKDEAVLKKESPLTYIDKLKTPLMIVHGGKDKRVPPSQAYELKEALEKRKIAYEWLFKSEEGHGFIGEENRKEFYQRTLKFLDKHLK